MSKEDNYRIHHVSISGGAEPSPHRTPSIPQSAISFFLNILYSAQTLTESVKVELYRWKPRSHPPTHSYSFIHAGVWCVGWIGGERSALSSRLLALTHSLTHSLTVGDVGSFVRSYVRTFVVGASNFERCFGLRIAVMHERKFT